MAEIAISTHLAAPADKIWSRLKSPQALMEVSKPLLAFKAIDPPTLGDQWEERDYLCGLWLYGFLPVGKQVLGIRIPPVDGDKRFLRDDGRGRFISRWDHTITIEPDGEGTRYEDRLHLEAGVLTPAIAVFARIFYGHRQKRWREIVAKDFAA
ncbi:MAG: hypothetical protein HRU11_03170 [Parvularculaceae bacterium]|nr:hypothetical protein [Parvularculaceae bacterium]